LRRAISRQFQGGNGNKGPSTLTQAGFSHEGLLQQNLPQPDSCTAANDAHNWIVYSITSSARSRKDSATAWQAARAGCRENSTKNHECACLQ
jgi:hypothetical protein